MRNRSASRGDSARFGALQAPVARDWLCLAVPKAKRDLGDSQTGNGHLTYQSGPIGRKAEANTGEDDPYVRLTK